VVEGAYTQDFWRLPRYVVDHIKVVKRDGADDPGNMQWQSLEDAEATNRWEN
jgi:hypothetical protein